VAVVVACGDDGEVHGLKNGQQKYCEVRPDYGSTTSFGCARSSLYIPVMISDLRSQP
jgi:hypothetical protein